MGKEGGAGWGFMVGDGASGVWRGEFIGSTQRRAQRHRGLLALGLVRCGFLRCKQLKKRLDLLPVFGHL